MVRYLVPPQHDLNFVLVEKCGIKQKSAHSSAKHHADCLGMLVGTDKKFMLQLPSTLMKYIDFCQSRGDLAILSLQGSGSSNSALLIVWSISPDWHSSWVLEVTPLWWDKSVHIYGLSQESKQETSWEPWTSPFSSLLEFNCFNFVFLTNNQNDESLVWGEKNFPD